MTRSRSLALLADGRLFAWGRNLHGQLGLGDSDSGNDRLTPVQVPNPGLGRIKAFAAGDNFTLVLPAPYRTVTHQSLRTDVRRRARPASHPMESNVTLLSL